MGNILNFKYNDDNLINDDDLDEILKHKNYIIHQNLLNFIKKFILTNKISLINNLLEIDVEINNIDENKYYVDKDNHYFYIICCRNNYYNIILNLILLGCKFKKTLRGNFNNDDIKILADINNNKLNNDDIDDFINKFYYLNYSN